MGTSRDNLMQRITELEGNLMEEQETLRIVKDDLKFCRNKNKNLEDQLKSKVTYIHETSHLYCSDGVHIEYAFLHHYNTNDLFRVYKLLCFLVVLLNFFFGLAIF